MSPLGKLVALSFFVSGAVGVVEPDHLVAIAQYLLTPPGVHTSPVFPLLMSIALLLVAPVSHAPKTVRVVAGLILVAGGIMLVLGPERLRVGADWAADQGPWTLRGIGGLIGALGLLIGFATDPGSTDPSH